MKELNRLFENARKAGEIKDKLQEAEDGWDFGIQDLPKELESTFWNLLGPGKGKFPQGIVNDTSLIKRAFGDMGVGAPTQYQMGVAAKVLTKVKAEFVTEGKQIKEAVDLNNGDRVKLKPEYAGNEAGEIFTVSQADGSRCWIGDKDGRGWYASYDMLTRVRRGQQQGPSW